MRFLWEDLQAEPSILDPFGTKFNAVGLDRIFGRGLTSALLLSTIAAGPFLMKMTTRRSADPATAGIRRVRVSTFLDIYSNVFSFVI